MTLLSFIIRLWLFATLLFIPAFANAQFVGDIFFVSPAVSIPKGGTGSLTISLFAGSKAFGATNSTVTYDPAQLEIVMAEAVPSGLITPTLKWEASGGIIKIVAVNGQSLTQPIGSVGLAKLTFRAVGSAGIQSKVTSAVKASYAADRTAFRAGTAYTAEVSIGTVIPSSSNSSNVSIASFSASNTDRRLQDKALSMRPAGHRVTLLVPSGQSGQFIETIVQTVDPSSSKELSHVQNDEVK